MRMPSRRGMAAALAFASILIWITSSDTVGGLVVCGPVTTTLLFLAFRPGEDGAAAG